MLADVFFNQVDDLYANAPEQVETYLQSQKQMGEDNHDIELQLMAINELIGFYRSRSTHQKAIDHSFIAIRLLGEWGLLHHLQGATTLLNCATAFKAAECFEEAKLLYERCLSIYQSELLETDERFAALYNNMSDLYQKLSDTQRAIDYLYQAIAIMDREHHPIEWATSMTNLGGLYLKEEKQEEAYTVLRAAQAVFLKIKAPHYGICLLYLGQIRRKIEDYEQGLSVIRQYFKENDDFKAGWEQYLDLLKEKQMYERYKLAKKKDKIKGMELSYTYYKEIGENILEKAFPDLFEKMTIGLLGMGSECYGMDDSFSQDHDFYPRFMIFVDEETDDHIVSAIQKVYDELPNYYLGYLRQHTRYSEKRDGVFKIETFFKQMLGQHYVLQNTLDWFYLDEGELSLIQNGKIFKEGNNTFNRWRQQLYYYNEDVRLKKIMSCLAKMAQAGQYNYARMMRREDIVAANQAQSLFIEETLKVLFLLKRVYSPYYKWRFKLAKELMENEIILQWLEDLVCAEFNVSVYRKDTTIVNSQDDKAVLIEKISKEIVKELKKQHLTDHEANFLQDHLENIRMRITDPEIKKMHVMEG